MLGDAAPTHSVFGYKQAAQLSTPPLGPSRERAVWLKSCSHSPAVVGHGVENDSAGAFACVYR